LTIGCEIPLTLANAQDILEILDDRYGHTSTVVIAQMPIADWFSPDSKSYPG